MSKCIHRVTENDGFFEVTDIHSSENNECVNSFSKWLNEAMNNFYSNLNSYHNMLYDINQIVRVAQHGVLIPDAYEKINHHYNIIYIIVNMRETLLTLKREMTGKFGKLSVVKGIIFSQ